jgi:hypothetical protein
MNHTNKSTEYMMITNVVQKGKYVYVYNERGTQTASIIISSLPGSGLKGYTSETVSIQQGSTIQAYDSRGSSIGTPFWSNDGEPTRTSSSGKGSFINTVIHTLFWLVALAAAFTFLS